MKVIVSITMDEDVYLNEEINNLKRTKKLSSFINNLLRESFNIRKQVVSADIEEIDKEILNTKIKMAVLEEKKKNIVEAEEKEANRWKTIM